MRGFSKIGLIFLLGFLFYLFWAQSFPITDPVESNYALTAKEMVGSGDWIAPRIYGKVWYDKPVMFYWLLAFMMNAFGYSDLVVRLVPALMGGLGLALIYWFVARLKGERAGIIAALLLGTSLQYFVISKLVITDMVLFVLDSAALTFFYLGYVNDKQTKRWYWPMYICLGLAVLTKGPVGVLLPGLVILVFLAWRKQWSELRQMKIPSGLLLFGLTVIPWYLTMYLKHGKDFIDTFLGVHNYLRATVSEHPKLNVWYYYPVLILVSALPWTGMAIGGIWKGIRDIRRQDDLALFSIVWAGVFGIFYSLMATKYPTYTFPIMFPLFVLTAAYLETAWAAKATPALLTFLGPLLFWLVALGVAALKYLHGSMLVCYLGLLVVGFGVALWGRLRKKSMAPFCGVVLSYLVFTMMVVPSLATARSGKHLAQTLTPYASYQIGIYQDYSTAAVYYSNHRLIALKPQAEIANFRNKSFSWFAKYTMPIRTIREFVTQIADPKLIIVPIDSQAEFLREAAGINFDKVTQSEDNLYYRVKGSVR